MTSGAVRRSLAGACALVLTAVPLAACGTASEVSRPAGVDDLVIPTPSPRPSDFVGRVDNRWFPLAPGTVWTYDVGLTGGVRTVTVETGAEVVAGVSTTVVRTEEAGATTTDRYAQDAAGNVWWFGHDGDAQAWRAGTDGARAGVVMLARPRIGDGYRQALLAGVVDARATVLGLDQALDVRAGTFTGVVETEDVRSDVDASRDSYAPGTGLVLSVPEQAGERVELVEVRSP